MYNIELPGMPERITGSSKSMFIDSSIGAPG